MHPNTGAADIFTQAKALPASPLLAAILPLYASQRQAVDTIASLVLELLLLKQQPLEMLREMYQVGGSCDDSVFLPSLTTVLRSSMRHSETVSKTKSRLSSSATSASWTTTAGAQQVKSALCLTRRSERRSSLASGSSILLPRRSWKARPIRSTLTRPSSSCCVRNKLFFSPRCHFCIANRCCNYTIL